MNAIPLAPADPDFAARVRDSFGRQPFMEHIGARITALEPGFCEITVDHRRELTQQHGFVHGGVLASIADSAAGYAAFSLMPAEASVLTVEYKLNLLLIVYGYIPRDCNHLIYMPIRARGARTLPIVPMLANP